MKRLIALILCVQMLQLPTGRRADAIEVPQAAPRLAESHAAIRLIRKEIEANPAYYYDEEELTRSQAVENKAIALGEVQSLISKLEDSSYSIDSIRQELIRGILAEEEAQAIELRQLIEKMPTESLDSLFEESLKVGAYNEELRQDYEAAYTLAEKQQIVLDLVKTDLARLKSVTVKKLGLLDRDTLLAELKTTKSLINTKGKDTWKVVLVVVIAVAAAGFVSWAVVSATKRHWERKTRDMEEDFADQEDRLRKDYANKEEELSAIHRERARLRDEGYVMTVCKTTERQSTVSCAFDLKSHSGTEVCITRCMRNPATGQELMPTTSCSSAYIPSNCFTPNPFVAGYEKGYDEGYDSGYKTSFDAAYHEAYQEHYARAYDKAYENGYSRGYDEGFTDGLQEAEYDDSSQDAAAAVSSSSGTDSVLKGFQKGYREGYAYASILKVGA